MILKDGTALYAPKYTKIIVMDQSRSDFIPSESSNLVDSNENSFRFQSTSLYYDRANRNKSWIILDLRTT